MGRLVSRSVKEWIGKDDDEAIPTRVKLRVFKRFGGRCAHCKLVIRGSLRPAFDHIQALTNVENGNRESALQLLCVPCHKVKTRADVGEKKQNNKVLAKHLGLKKRKGRPFPGGKDSGIKMKIGGGFVRR